MTGCSLRQEQVNTGSINVQSLTVFDPDQLVEAVGSSHLIHTQLTGGDFRGSLLGVEFGSLRLDTGCYSQSLISRGAFPADRIIIGCLLDAKQSGCLNGYRFGRHDMVVFPEGAELDYLLPADTRWVAIQISRNKLENTLQARLPMQGVKLIPGSVVARFGFVSHLKGLLAHIENGRAPGFRMAPRDAELFESLLFDDICSLLAAEWRDLGTRSHHTRNMGLLQRFERMVEDSPDNNLRVSSVARRLAISPRTLEQTCKDYLGLSPKQYMNCLRLNAVHRELVHKRNDSVTVESVARAHGVSHLGRFSAYYREQFGCNPSVTLNKRFL